VHCVLFIFQCSNNYGGALGGSAFAKGLEGNRSLRVSHQSICSSSVYLAGGH
jgi:hypothetical protein